MAQYTSRLAERRHHRRLAGLMLLWPMVLNAAAPHSIAQQATPVAMQSYLASAYGQVKQSAAALDEATDKHCSAAVGKGESAADARQAMLSAFETLALAWSRVSFIRIGPYREDHAGQRMQFWPDKRGSGERQIQQALISQPEALTAPNTLRQQSVALQGLPAYEAVLKDMIQPASGSASTASANFHCDYLETLAENMAANSKTLAERMSEGAEAIEAVTFAQWMEVVRGGLQIAGEMKLKAVAQSMRAHLAKPADTATPGVLELTRKVPFSRSHLAMASIGDELEGLAALLESAQIENLLQSSDAGYLASVRFQLAQAGKAVESLDDLEGKPISAAALNDAIGVVDYASGMLAQTGSDMMTTLYPALGLSRGFNSMDGD
ncbi:imelysin family protein [Allohahella sp. A8]|uniref:imelysin family protein n=1 Tax=Allohahella sp. A8 TaxID=3141461 RepID=UPI003A7FC778